MTPRPARGPVVIDTDVYGAQLVPGSVIAVRYEPIIVGPPAFICFQTTAELRYGALLRNWGERRMRQLEARLAAAEIVHSGPDLVGIYARLRVECERACHALSQRVRDADRWVAAAAIRLGIPLVSNDGVFRDGPWPGTRNCPGALIAGRSGPVGVAPGPWDIGSTERGWRSLSTGRRRVPEPE